MSLGELFINRQPESSILPKVLSYLDPRDLIAASAVNKATREAAERAWEALDRALSYPVDPGLRLHKNYENFIVDLKTRIRKYPEEQIPKAIRAILELKTAPTVKQAQLLHNFIRARDTLVVWHRLAEDANTEVDFEGVYDTPEAAIKRAEDFSIWMVENSAPLSEITILVLDELQLTVVPEELGNLRNLQALDLTNNQLRVIPQELRNLTNLHGLGLQANQLREIPQQLANLTNLQLLNLGINQLRVIPQQLGNLTNLQELYLHENQFQVIPHQLGNLTNLRVLWLLKNELHEIPAELGNLTSLQKINLSLNRLRLIPQQLGNLTNLQWLGLGANQLRVIPQQLEQFADLPMFTLIGNPLLKLPRPRE